MDIILSQKIKKETHLLLTNSKLELIAATPDEYP